MLRRFLVDELRMIKRQVRKFAEHEVIFQEGDDGDCAYLIETGRVLVYLVKDGQEIPLKVLGRGEIFGEMSMIDHSPRSASCKALTEVRLIGVTQKQLLDRIKSADPIVRLLMRALSDRLRLQNDTIRGKALPTNQLHAEAIEQERREAIDRIELENRISFGLENNEFVPYYQPIYNLHTQKIQGCEALIRWLGPDGKITSPSVFIDILEESSLILDVGQMMIEKCFAHLSAIKRETGLPNDFFVSINISGRQFGDPHFIEHLEQTRALTGHHAHHVKLEVTERIMTEGPLAISTLQKCRSLGYQIAIDDFGTGFSSLQYLASMPLSDLKVDRSFVNQMTLHDKSLSMVKTLIYMANALNLNLIAEGIETQEQLLLLQNLGVTQGQGYLFCKAVPFDEFLALFAGRDNQKKAA